MDLINILTDVVLNAINIVLLYIIVRLIVYKPVKKFLNDRRAKIEAEAYVAKEMKSEAEKTKAEYEAKLVENEHQANLAFHEAEEKAAVSATRIIEEANKKAELILEEARAKAEEEKADSAEKLRGEAAELAVEISAKLLKREVTDADNLRIAQEFFDQPEDTAPSAEGPAV